MNDIQTLITKSIKDVFDVDITPVLTRPSEQFGDYATNAALVLAKQLDKNPREVAEAIAAKLKGANGVAVAEVAGPGFINLTLSDERLIEAVLAQLSQPLAGKVIVAEYSDPNPFKVLHAGHLYTSVVGDAIANLLEAAGATVHRVNFGGDVGLHVGKTMWAILKKLGGEYPENLQTIPEEERAQWMADAYVEGTNAYEEDQRAKEQIAAYNKQVYALHAGDDHDSPFAKIYWTCRQWSYNYFDAFYERIGTKFEKYYPESQVAGQGFATVKEQLENGVFKESNGAVIFEGEKFGLHTRVFINSEGIPTYEAKDVGLILAKWQDYNFDMSVVITGNEQEQYMTVVLKAVEQFRPELAQATKHLAHGIVKLAGGVKMSSRKGNILRAVDVLDVAREANLAATGKDDPAVVLAAVKYSFLKNRMGGDIIYDPAESVALEGNSGPYLQYAHARARSILAKKPSKNVLKAGLEADERSLLRKISEYREVVTNATEELMPHHICTYLYELAQVFNRFYEKNRVIGDSREEVRLALVTEYARVLKAGLGLLGIHAPEHM